MIKTKSLAFEHTQAKSASNTASNTNAELQANNAIQTDRFLTYSYYGKTPQLNVYDTQTALANNPGGATANAGQAVVYDQSENTVRFHFGTTNPASFS